MRQYLECARVVGTHGVRGMMKLVSLADSPEALAKVKKYYTENKDGEQAFYTRLAESHKLLITGGSDFHGSNKPDIALGTGFGDLCIPYRILEDIKARRRSL